MPGGSYVVEPGRLNRVNIRFACFGIFALVEIEANKNAALTGPEVIKFEIAGFGHLCQFTTFSRAHGCEVNLFAFEFEHVGDRIRHDDVIEIL